MEVREYFSANPGHQAEDATKTAELKTFSKEIDTAERRHEVTLRASAEHDRRVRRFMLFGNIGYEEASRLLADQDKELMALYVFGEVRE